MVVIFILDNSCCIAVSLVPASKGIGGIILPFCNVESILILDGAGTGDGTGEGAGTGDYFYCDITGSFLKDIFDIKSDTDQDDDATYYGSLPAGGILGEE